MTKTSLAALVALLLFLIPESNAQTRSKMGLRLQSFVDDGKIPGAVTLVIRRGQILNFEAVGYQDIETKIPMRTDTIFDIRSMTKPVTAIGVRASLCNLCVLCVSVSLCLCVSLVQYG